MAQSNTLQLPRFGNNHCYTEEKKPSSYENLQNAWVIGSCYEIWRRVISGVGRLMFCYIFQTLLTQERASRAVILSTYDNLSRVDQSSTTGNAKAEKQQTFEEDVRFPTGRNVVGHGGPSATSGHPAGKLDQAIEILSPPAPYIWGTAGLPALKSSSTTLQGGAEGGAEGKAELAVSVERTKGRKTQ